jgi:Ala-tRNA(Pro) deacylase
VKLMHEAELRLYEVLERLEIPFTRYEHPPVFTVDEAEEHWAAIPATHCKNLFLRNRKGNRHYLVVLQHARKVHLKAIEAWVADDRLSFASPDRLMRYLGLLPGSVSPFGLVNDSDRVVQVLLDGDLKAAAVVGFHPNVNTATITLSFRDFERFLAWRGNVVRYLPGTGTTATP